MNGRVTGIGVDAKHDLLCGLVDGEVVVAEEAATREGVQGDSEGKDGQGNEGAHSESPGRVVDHNARVGPA